MRKQAQTLCAEAEHLLEKKQYDAAIVKSEQSLVIFEKIEPDSANVNMVLYQLARIYEKKGEHARSIPYLQRRLKIVEKTHSNDPELLYAIEAVASAMLDAGQYEHSIAMSERAISVAIQLDHGPDRERSRASVSQIGRAQKGLRRYDAAEASFLRAIKIVEAQDRQPALDWVLRDLGELYYELGLFARAEPVLLRALQLELDHGVPGNMPRSLMKLAFTRLALEDFAGSEGLADEAIRLSKSPGEPSASFIAALLFRAWIDIGSGAYDHAAPLLEQAQTLLEKLEAKGDSDAEGLRAEVRSARGRLATLEGDYKSAEELLVQADAFIEKKGSPRDKADSAARLADLYRRANHWERAEQYATLAMTLSDAELAPTHPTKAENRATLALIREGRGDAKSAKKLHEQALAMREGAFGKEHPLTAKSVLDLADLERRAKHAADAEALYKRAIGIFEKNYGREHEKIAVALEGLSSLYAAQGKVDLAIRIAERAAELREKQAALVVAGGSESQKRSFVLTMRAGSDWVASLHARIAPTDENAKRLALQTVLQRKGRVLDVMASSLAALRRTLTVEEAALLDELVRARADVAILAMRGPMGAPLDEFRAELARREARAHSIEDRLGTKGGTLRAEQVPVSIERVQALLPEDAAMVEISLYSPRNAVDAEMPSVEGSPRFSAYVLDSKGRVEFVDLGESAPIEAQARGMREALAKAGKAVPTAEARALDALVMQKIRPLLAGKTRVLVSADGALSLVPFAAFVDENGKYLVESLDISYLTSGRDMLRLARQGPPRHGALVVADPAFGPRASTESALSLLDEGKGTTGPNRGLDKAYFVPLPATAAEARAIASILPKPDVRIDIEATEPVLKQIHAPRILHIATHGFFLPSKSKVALSAPPAKQKAQRGLELTQVERADWLPDDPLLRSGLALSGANAKNGGGGEDGILTALEASSLDLWGTKLVVLSACETGLGDVQRGEGVYGLRRALFIAGTETLVASLWKVADEETKTLMVGYYERIQKGVGRGVALREQQLAMLKKPETAHPFYWASFGVFGDPSPIGTLADEEVKKAETETKIAPTKVDAKAPKITLSTHGCACGIASEERATGKALLWGTVLGASLALRRARKRNGAAHRHHG